MTSLIPRPPYTAEELARFYPSQLELRQVQVIFRHGLDPNNCERTPVSARLKEAGVPEFWPQCQSASRFAAAVLSTGGSWDSLPYRRRLETFGPKDKTVFAAGPGKRIDGVCLNGQLTDRGRETTLALGERLRNLYVDRLSFLPPTLTGAEDYYLRATPIGRARESLQQVFTGMYPTANRDPNYIPIVYTRNPQDEILFPNEPNCRRFNQLSLAFADLAAKTYNDSPEIEYLQSKIGKWMPPGQKVAVDSHPRLSGLTDTVSATDALGDHFKLPPEFYDPKVRQIMNDINVDEWFRGYEQSSEYRRLGVGALLGDIKERAVQAVNGGAPKLALMGCHDTTIAGILATLGAFDKQWPPFTSSIAVESFRLRDPRRKRSFFSFRNNDEENWYVRVRYNDQPVVVRGCKPVGKHLEGDETFCTMKAFRETVEKVAPENWKQECLQNMDKPGIPKVEELE